jgi:hypothetical protein
MYKDVANNLELFKIKYPKTFVPLPNDIDYRNGFIERYFVRKANDNNGHIFEVNEDVYNNYQNNPFWICEKLYWRISGPLDGIYDETGIKSDIGVRASNRESIKLLFKRMPNLGLYLPNLLQFHK